MAVGVLPVRCNVGGSSSYRDRVGTIARGTWHWLDTRTAARAALDTGPCVWGVGRCGSVHGACLVRLSAATPAIFSDNVRDFRQSSSLVTGTVSCENMLASCNSCVAL
jgi:hypothetical protein